MMKFFKLAFAVLLMVGLSQSVLAQKFYGKVRGGYGVGVTKEGYYTGLNQGMVTPTSKEQVFASLGAGIPVSVSAGYFLTKNMGVELDLGYLHGEKARVVDYNIPGVAVQVADAYTRQFQFSPNVIMSSDLNDNWKVYTKVGFVLPLGGASYIDLVNSTNPSAIITSEQKITGKPSLGYKGVLGIEYRLGEKVGLFTEIEGIHLKIKRGELEVTSFNVAGQDQLANYQTITGNPVKVTYEDRLEGADLTDKSKALTTISPYGKLGMNIGLTWYF